MPKTDAAFADDLHRESLLRIDCAANIFVIFVIFVCLRDLRAVQRQGTCFGIKGRRRGAGIAEDVVLVGAGDLRAADPDILFSDRSIRSICSVYPPVVYLVRVINGEEYSGQIRVAAIHD